MCVFLDVYWDLKIKISNVYLINNLDTHIFLQLNCTKKKSHSLLCLLNPYEEKYSIYSELKDNNIGRCFYFLMKKILICTERNMFTKLLHSMFRQKIDLSYPVLIIMTLVHTRSKIRTNLKCMKFSDLKILRIKYVLS